VCKEGVTNKVSLSCIPRRQKIWRLTQDIYDGDGADENNALTLVLYSSTKRDISSGLSLAAITFFSNSVVNFLNSAQPEQVLGANTWPRRAGPYPNIRL